MLLFYTISEVYTTFGIVSANENFDFFENNVFKFIYSFHMPLFMLVSGYLFFFSCKKRNLKELLVHRTQSILQPLIMCTILNYFLTYSIINRSLKGIIDGPWVSTLNIYWFLWSVLSSSLALGIIYKVTSKIAIRIFGLIIGAFFVSLFPNWELNIFMYPFFVIGFLFAQYRERIPSAILKMRYVFLVLFPIMLLFYEKKHYIYTSGIVPSNNVMEILYIDGFRWAIGLAGSIFMLVVVELICKWIFFKHPKLANPIAVLGKKSLQMYCISVIILSFWLPVIYGKICRVVGTVSLVPNIYVYSFLFTPALAIIYSILIYYIVRFMEKTKLSKIIFGR